MVLDHEKLTYHYAGRDMRLTDVKGNVVKKVVGQVGIVLMVLKRSPEELVGTRRWVTHVGVSSRRE
jgi:hypothetical protein